MGRQKLFDIVEGSNKKSRGRGTPYIQSETYGLYFRTVSNLRNYILCSKIQLFVACHTYVVLSQIMDDGLVCYDIYIILNQNVETTR